MYANGYVKTLNLHGFKNPTGRKFLKDGKV